MSTKHQDGCFAAARSASGAHLAHANTSEMRRYAPILVLSRIDPYFSGSTSCRTLSLGSRLSISASSAKERIVTRGGPPHPAHLAPTGNAYFECISCGVISPFMNFLRCSTLLICPTYLCSYVLLVVHAVHQLSFALRAWRVLQELQSLPG